MARIEGEFPGVPSCVLATEAVEKLAAAPFRGGDPGQPILLYALQAQFGPIRRNRGGHLGLIKEFLHSLNPQRTKLVGPRP